MASAALPQPRRWRVITALGGLVTRFRRAHWRRVAESILMDEYGWSLEAAVDHVDLIEDVAETLIANGTIRRWPSARDAIGVPHGHRRKAR
jgi:hypothetical protein